MGWKASTPRRVASNQKNKKTVESLVFIQKANGETEEIGYVEFKPYKARVKGLKLKHTKFYKDKIGLSL